MINASQSFIDAVAQSSRRFRMRMYDGNNEIAGNLRSAKIHLGSTGPEAFAIGAVYSGYAEIVLDGRETTLEGKELRLDVGVQTDAETDAYEYITLGYFTALAPAATKYRTTFTACGRIVSKLAVTDFTAPTVQTIQAVADAITAQTGVAVEFDAGIDTTGVIETPVPGNCRDALTRIAECVMGYATETNTGSVRVARFSVTPTAEYNAADMVTLPAITDINFQITGVQAITNTGVFETGTPNVSIESNYITETLFNQFAPGLVGIEYRPGNVQLALGDPRIEAADVLRVVVDSDIYIVPCFSITHTFDGGLQTEIVTPSVQNVGKVTGTLSQGVADAKATAAQAAAQVDDAKKVATSYLSRDSSGFMVANMVGDVIYTPGTVPSGVMNAFLNNNSLQIRDGQDVLASYGTEAAIYTKDGTELAHFGYAYGNDAEGGTSINPYYTLGRRAANTDVGNYSLAVGNRTEASGYASMAMGSWSKASGYYAIAMGSQSEASGVAATAMGRSVASGDYATALGEETEASGNYSFAANFYNVASGESSVAMGGDNEASGRYSSAIGKGLKVSADFQSVRGRWNIEDYDGKYIDLIGNGTGPTARARSNAFGILVDGDPEICIGSTVQRDVNLRNVLTKLGWLQELYTDNDKMLSLKSILYKMLSREPTVIYNNELYAPAAKATYASDTVEELADYKVVVLRCHCANTMQNLVFCRALGDVTQRISDYGGATYSRGEYYVDWTNNQINVRWRDGAAPGSDTDINNNFKIMKVVGIM